jgi:hypothetical protein
MVINNRMRCPIVTLMHFIRFTGFALQPSCDSIAFAQFACRCCLHVILFGCERHLHATLFGCRGRLRAVSLLSRDLFVGIVIVRLWL